MGVLIDTSALPPAERFASWREWWAPLFRLGAVTLLHVRSRPTWGPGSASACSAPCARVTHRGGSQLARIKSHIDANLADPGLTPRAIVERHYVSVRQLHKLFEDEQLTVGRWIRHRRLDRCRAELADPALAGEQVRAIAARWGMANASHFAHAFRLAYGCSPQEYRRQCPTRLP